MRIMMIQMKMKNSLSLALLSTFACLFFNAKASIAIPTFESMPIAEVKAAPNLKILRFQILSINCAACANAMSTKMAELEGVEYVKIDMVKPVGAQAEVIFAPNKIQPDAITDVVHDFHYSEAAVKSANWPESKGKTGKPRIKTQKSKS